MLLYSQRQKYDLDDHREEYQRYKIVARYFIKYVQQPSKRYVDYIHFYHPFKRSARFLERKLRRTFFENESLIASQPAKKLL